MKPRLLATAAVAATVTMATACSQPADGPAAEPTQTVPLTNQVSPHPGSLVVDTTFGALPLPTMYEEVTRRMARMPSTVESTPAKTPREPWRVLYGDGAREFRIEARSIRSFYSRPLPPLVAFERLRLQTYRHSEHCAEPPEHCFIGETGDGQVAIIWGHDKSKRAMTAAAPDRQTLVALLNAWATT